MLSKPVPFFLRALVALLALAGVLAVSYLAREQAAAPKSPLTAEASDREASELEASVPEVDVALFAVG